MAKRKGSIARNRLNRHQRRLLQELEDVSSLTGVDFRHILEDCDAELRTVMLHNIRDQLVRGYVVIRYTLVDESLGTAICHYFFGRRSFVRLWKTEPFRRFNHYILETMTLLEKLRLVRAIRELPKQVRSDIEALNGLRNGLAHSFFPQNLRSSRPVWKGLSIFSIEGLDRFVEDTQRVIETLARRAYGGRGLERAMASAFGNRPRSMNK